jgi:hypothetical protein
MAINIRTKGASAEREIATTLNGIIIKVLKEKDPTITLQSNHNYFVQRNQQQTAVGGNDLINTYGFGIEVKRQELLSINTWWKQCVAAANKNGETPVLLYRQTRKQWKCVMGAFVGLPNNQFGACRAEIDFETFLLVFEKHVRHRINS